MLEKDLKNLSLQMKIQEQLARPLFSGIRRAAVSTDFIARLKAEQLDTPLIPSHSSKFSKNNGYQRPSVSRSNLHYTKH